uniref:Biogenesis of lysosome-related organelles complex 1 subunit 1 n=1 Tax=Salmo trutta TaxID=8032 RepID=A0A673Z238_SALTR
MKERIQNETPTETRCCAEHECEGCNLCSLPTYRYIADVSSDGDEPERRRREAIAAATCLTEALVDHLNVGVAQAYVNQRKLDHEVKTLQVQASQFSKQTAQWISMVEGFNQALKEIGDVENWARSIEMDMRTIATALEYVHKGPLTSASS